MYVDDVFYPNPTIPKYFRNTTATAISATHIDTHCTQFSLNMRRILRLNFQTLHVFLGVRVVHKSRHYKTGLSPN